MGNDIYTNLSKEIKKTNDIIENYQKDTQNKLNTLIEKNDKFIDYFKSVNIKLDEILKDKEIKNIKSKSFDNINRKNLRKNKKKQL